MKIWHKSLLAQLVSYFLLLSLLTGTAASVITYRQARRALEEATIKQIQTVADLKENEVLDWVDTQTREVASIAQMPELHEPAMTLMSTFTSTTALTNTISLVLASPAGDRLVTYGADQSLRLWDTATGQTLRLWEKPAGADMFNAATEPTFQRVVFHPDGDQLAFAWGQKVVLVETETGETEFEMPVSFPLVISYSPDGSMLAVGNFMEVPIWDTATGEKIASLSHETSIFDLAFSPDGERLAVGEAEGGVKLWEVATGREIAAMAHTDWIWDVRFSEDGSYFGTASTDGTVRIWDGVTGEEKLALEHPQGAFIVVFSPKGDRVLTIGMEFMGYLWDLTDGRLVTTVHPDGILDAQFSPDGSWLVTGGSDKTAHIWDTETGEERLALSHEETVGDLDVDPEGRWIATSSPDGKVRVWDAASGELLSVLDHPQEVVTLEVLEDGERIATGSVDGIARLWDVASGQEVIRCIHDTAAHRQIRNLLVRQAENESGFDDLFFLTPAGTIAVSTDRSREGTSWDEAPGLVAEQEELAIISGPEGAVMAVAAPIPDEAGEPLAVLAARYPLHDLNAILTDHPGLGETGEIYLVDEEHRLIVAGDVEGDAGRQTVRSAGIDVATGGADGGNQYVNYADIPVVGAYHWLEELSLALLVEMAAQEALAGARNLVLVVLGVGLIAAAIMTVGIYLLARRIARPILTVADAAASIEAETFELEALERVGKREDEVGRLAQIFQRMAREVQEREQRLHQRVQELRVEIDEIKRTKQVDEIVQSDFFNDLQVKANDMRNRRQHNLGPQPSGGTTTPVGGNNVTASS